MSENLRVHFIGLGFKCDWIKDSIKTSRPDKVYLFRRENESAPEALAAQKQVVSILKKKDIPYIFVAYNRSDLFDLLKRTREILEQENRNFVYLNISGGEREIFLTFALSSMLFKKTVRGLKLYSMQQGDFNRLPSLETKLPSQDLIESMRFIASRGNQCGKKELKKYVFEKGIVRAVKKTEPNEYMKLNRSIIDKLLQWDFIEVEGKGKGSIIKLKEDGQNLIKFL